MALGSRFPLNGTKAFGEFAKERMTILNAYYVPEEMRSKLTARMTPVNSFRLLFNTCFGEHFTCCRKRT